MAQQLFQLALAAEDRIAETLIAEHGPQSSQVSEFLETSAAEVA
jgi:hypothetical protein